MEFDTKLLNLLENLDSNKEEDIYYVLKIITDELRKEKNSDPVSIDVLISVLQARPDLAERLSNSLKNLFTNKEFYSIISEADLIKDQGFFGELRKRIGNKLFPVYTTTDSVERIIQNVLYKNEDDVWFRSMDNNVISEILELLNLDTYWDKNGPIRQQLNISLYVLIKKITALGLDKKLLLLASNAEILAPLPDDTNTFQLLDMTFSAYLDQAENGASLDNFIVSVKQCQAFLSNAYSNIPQKGIVYADYLKLVQLEKLLERVNFILTLIKTNTAAQSEENRALLIKYLITLTHDQTKIGKHIDKTTQIYAREITRIIANKGENYITDTLAEYLSLFRKALGGGAIVAVACLVKVNLSAAPVSLFAKALLFSANYALAFTMIYLLHLSLATKQPAMTAAKLANNIESDIKNKSNFGKLTETVSQIWRSQFIAFAGNVIMVMPVTYLLITAWIAIFKTNPAAGKAEILVNDLIFYKTPMILHAAIAGVFLFISGLIAGSVANQIKANHVYERIMRFQLLKDIIGLKNTTKLAGFIDQHWSGVISNVWFGIFMGSVGVIGTIIGLNIDIRHITFAAGNFILAWVGSDYTLTPLQISMSMLGIALIGFINFTVSFSLSLFLALRARGIKFNQLDDVFGAIIKKFTESPLSFFFPTKSKL